MQAMAVILVMWVNYVGISSNKVIAVMQVIYSGDVTGNVGISRDIGNCNNVCNSGNRGNVGINSNTGNSGS